MMYVPQEVSWFKAIRSRCRVIEALIIREIHTRFGRDNLGYVWLFVEPAMLGLGVALMRVFIRGMGHDMPGGINKFAFFIIGYIVFYLFRTVVNRSANGIQANVQLFYHSRVTIEAVMMARNVLDMGAVMVCMSAFCVIIGVIYGDWPYDPLHMVAGVLLMFGLSHGFGLCLLSLTAMGADLIDRLVHPFTYLMLPFSGMFYMMWWLPQPFQDILWWVPLVHIMEFTREGQFGPGIPYHYDLTYVAIWIVGLNFLGLCAIRAGRPHFEM
ncbi:ABC transporter permease [Roseococcus sp. YIM B11640]|uniref:ABC transporter permease n=1 Tax=Roseococcus sp. YIM B11640 TaxID=3133973 RepID=UPI003C79B66E